MLEINLLDETFDLNQSHNYHLSIQTGSNGLSMCLMDTIRNKYIGLRYHRFPDQSGTEPGSALQKIIETDDLLQLKYKSARALIVNKTNTLVPIPFFDETRQEDVFRLNHRLPSNAGITSNKLSTAYVYNIFSVTGDLQGRLTSQLPGIRIMHHSSPFIEHMVHESTRWTRPKCHVLIHEDTLDIGIAQLKKLLFYNSFRYRENADIVYFILSVLERFQLSAMYTDVYVSVDAENRDEKFDFIGNYLNMIRFIKPSDQFSYSYIFDEIQLTRFANLFNLLLCE